MENNRYSSLESKRIKEIAKEYMEKGYDVVVEPSADMLPPFLKDYHPDILVKSQNENIIIEVKTQVSIAKSEYLEEIAKRINQHAKWRFELIITNPKKNTVSEKDEPPLQLIIDKINLSLKLAKKDLPESSLLYGWACFEALARKILRSEQPHKQIELTPSALIKQLFSYGIVEKDDYSYLLHISKIRNEIAHGFFNARQKIETTDLLKLNDINNRLISEISTF